MLRSLSGLKPNLLSWMTPDYISKWSIEQFFAAPSRRPLGGEMWQTAFLIQPEFAILSYSHN
tara:strand:+ start:477 stop:662 length:186 start_codon:yes stop_codon:yes gene_type:complete